MPRFNHGIALLQVLLITGIITVLALYFVSTAKDQVAIAQLSNDRVQAQLAIKTAESELLLALLTEFREATTDTTSPIIQRWNFYNQAFVIGENVTAQIQDQAGLMAAQFLDVELLVKMYRENGLDEKQAPVLVDSLLDWQDADKLRRLNGAESSAYEVGPRNGSISLKHEISQVQGMSFNAWAELQNSLTLYRRSPFNPMSSTPQILKAVLGEGRAAEYIGLRQTNLIDAAKFSGITGLNESDQQIFYPGDVMAITLKAKRGEIELSKWMMVELQPYAGLDNSPVDYLEIRQ
jgi:general secretion pathway protein K